MNLCKTRTAWVALAAALALAGCSGDSGPSRDDVVAGMADMLIAGGATPGEMCQSVALLGGADGAADYIASVSDPATLSSDMATLTAAEEAALAEHGVTAADVLGMVADGEGRTTREGAEIMADAMVAACGAE